MNVQRFFLFYFKPLIKTTEQQKQEDFQEHLHDSYLCLQLIQMRKSSGENTQADLPHSGKENKATSDKIKADGPIVQIFTVHHETASVCSP